MASRADTWMPFYVADYLKDTMHLTRDQHGGYMLLLMACWNGGGRLPDDNAQLAALAKATPAEWRKMAPILRRFFTVEGDQLVQGRVVQEHEKAQRLSDIRRENGGKGGRPKKQTETAEKATGLANGKLNETPSPSPVGKEADASTPTEEAIASLSPGATSKGKDRSYPEAFEAAWKAYPHHKGRSSKPNALAEWRKLPEVERAGLVTAVGRFAPNVAETCGGKGAPDMAVWLKAGKHLNWQAESASTAPAAPTFHAPQVRASIVHATDEDFAVRYLDHYCRWDGETRRIEAVKPAIAAALTGRLNGWAERNRVTIAVMAANDPKPDLFAEGKRA